MGSSVYAPPFENVIALVCYLVRYTLTPSMEEIMDQWDAGIKKPPHTLVSLRGAPDPGEEATQP